MERAGDGLPQPSAPSPHPGAHPSWGAGPACPWGPPSGGSGTLPPLLLLVFSAGFFCAPSLVRAEPSWPTGLRDSVWEKEGPPPSPRGPGVGECIWRDDGAAWAHHLEDARDSSGPLPHQENVSRSADPRPGEGTGWGLGVAPAGTLKAREQDVPRGPEDTEQGTHPRALHGSVLKRSPSCWTFLSKSGFGAQQTWAISACSGRCCWGKGLWEWGAEGAPEGGAGVISG